MTFKSSILQDLEWRGLIAQVTDAQALDDYLCTEGATVYCGFDATSDSLTIGNLVALMTLFRFRMHGARAIVLLGEATALIGDPSFRDNEREECGRTAILHNVHNFEQQVRKVFGKQEEPSHLLIRGNAKTFDDMSYTMFMTEIGRHVCVNDMLRRESMKQRREKGLTFAELGYMVMQALDFNELWMFENCRVQIGGNDQWGNICSGIDLIRKRHQPEHPALGMTVPLLTRADGSKIGKSSGTPVWLSEERTSPWEFFNYWINLSDEEAIQHAKWFLPLSRDATQAILDAATESDDPRSLQKSLARQMTSLIYGDEAMNRCRRVSEALFNNDISELDDDDMTTLDGHIPTAKLSRNCLSVLADMLVEAKVATSKRDARTLLEQGAISINGRLVRSVEDFTAANLHLDKFALIRRGKKNWHLAVLEG
tara:strand:- start:102958 stop:104235 length:1278 start_codon:yes stop_codon:yes gene_type:complete